MNNIEITQDNYELYRKFYDIKKGNYVSPRGKDIGQITGILILIMAMVGSCGIITLFQSFNFILMIVYAILMTAICMDFTFNFPYRYTMKQFKKEHPDFNTEIDINELEKELEKYEKLSKIDDLKKDIETMKLEEENHLSKFGDDFKEKSLDEKISALDVLIQEKETLEEVRQYYQTIKENEEYYQELLKEYQQYESQQQTTHEESTQKKKKFN